MIDNTYSNYISLGSFCSISLDLEKLGLRNCSYPFDWLITNSTKEVLNLINNQFYDFLNLNYLYQNIHRRNVYRNTKFYLEFVHDFDGWKSIDSQIIQVKKKYERRIIRFYEDIKNPTLFVRYLINEEDVIFVRDNHDYIIKELRKFNEKNDIIFVVNDDLKDIFVNVRNFYFVKKDHNDTVCRHPLLKNEELFEYFSSTPYIQRESNLQRYKKMKAQKTFKRGVKLFINMFVLKYKHINQY